MAEEKSTKEKEKKEKPKYSMFQSLGFMLSLSWKNVKSVMVFSVILALLSVASSLIGLFIAPMILQKIEISAQVGELLMTILFFVLGLIVVSGMTAYINTNTIFGRIAIRGRIVALIHEKYMKMSFQYTEDEEIGKKADKASMAVSGNSQATEAIWGTLTSFLVNVLGFVIYLFMLTSMEPLIIVVILVTSVIGFFVNKHIYSWGYRHRDEESEYSKKMNYSTDVSRDRGFAKDLRIFGMRNWIDEMYEKSYRLHRAFSLRRERVYILANIVDLVLAFLRNGVAYFYLINMVLNDGLSASQFLLYFSAIGGFAGWVTGIMNVFSTMYTQCLDISTVMEFINYPEVLPLDEGEPIEPDNNKPYEFELRNVCFRYPKAEKDTLSNINLKIKAGENLAIVGLNGAGKTTLVKVLCGFYEPTSGEVLLNGENIKKYNRRDYYKLFSAVFQNFSIIAYSIACNVSQKADNYDMKKVEECIEVAGLTEKIKSLSNGYETNCTKAVFEDGIELSGGELQRLMLARALYKNAPVLVLDEPTAALDPIAESELYEKYNSLTSGKTSVYISHRLASTRFCDRVILLDKNVLAEEGTHESLLALKGKYAELYEIQSKYYQEGGVFVDEN